MASEVTHIVYGKKIFDRLPKKLDWKEFAIGTSYPDIRYLSHVSRESTHVFNTSEENVPLDNSFEAGKYVHCYVDEKRNNLLDELGMFELFEHSYENATALKLYEDVVMYGLFNNWREVSVFFATILPTEIKDEITEDNVKIWHDFTGTYLSNPPNAKIWRKLFETLKFPEEKINSIISKTEEFAENEKIKEILLKVYKKI